MGFKGGKERVELAGLEKSLIIYMLRGCFKLSGHRFIGWQFQRIGNVLGCKKIGKKQDKVNYAVSEKENWVKVRQC